MVHWWQTSMLRVAPRRLLLRLRSAVPADIATAAEAAAATVTGTARKTAKAAAAAATDASAAPMADVDAVEAAALPAEAAVCVAVGGAARSNLSATDPADPVVQHIVLRTDLVGWTQGMLMTQACHASLAAIVPHLGLGDADVDAYVGDLPSMHKVMCQVSGYALAPCSFTALVFSVQYRPAKNGEHYFVMFVPSSAYRQRTPGKLVIAVASSCIATSLRPDSILTWVLSPFLKAGIILTLP